MFSSSSFFEEEHEVTIIVSTEHLFATPMKPIEHKTAVCDSLSGR